MASATKHTGGELRSPPLANNRTQFTLDVDPHSHKHTETRRRHTEFTRDDHTELTRWYSGRPTFTFPCLSDSITRLMCSLRVLTNIHKPPLSHTCDSESPTAFIVCIQTHRTSTRVAMGSSRILTLRPTSLAMVSQGTQAFIATTDMLACCSLPSATLQWHMP